jgi:hypothetical protein
MRAPADTEQTTHRTQVQDLFAQAMRMPLALVLLVLQLPLILNPGYFSHDELQWWSRADVASWRDLPWVPWLDISPLQYRPLTFNLWLVLAHAFAATPQLMHLVVVALGTANAWLLARVLAGARVPAHASYAAAVVFALSPCIVYVHGWTGTLADLLTLLFALVAARLVQGATPSESIGTSAWRAVAAALLVALALLCKESAIVLPALLVFAAYHQPSGRTARLAALFSAAVVIAYLALRFPVLAESASTTPAYAWSIRNIPARTVEYLLYPFMPPLFEIASLLKASAARMATAAACVVLLLGALATLSWRWPAAWLLAFSCALAPVLVLPIAYDQYAYLASAIAVTIAACAWPRIRKPPRVILAILAIVAIVHGAAVMWRMVDAGVVERNLHADLLAMVEQAPDTALVVAAADPRDAWLVQRLLHDVDRYRGVPLTHVRAAENGESDAGARRLRMNRDGHLQADPTP